MVPKSTQKVAPMTTYSQNASRFDRIVTIDLSALQKRLDFIHFLSRQAVADGIIDPSIIAHWAKITDGMGLAPSGENREGDEIRGAE